MNKLIAALLLAALPFAAPAAAPNQADLLVRHATIVDVDQAA